MHIKVESIKYPGLLIEVMISLTRFVACNLMLLVRQKSEDGRIITSDFGLRSFV